MSNVPLTILFSPLTKINKFNSDGKNLIIEIIDDEIESMTYNMEDGTVFYYFTYQKQ